MAEVAAGVLTEVLVRNKMEFANFIGTYFKDAYTGSRFEFFDGGGDAEPVKNKFTYADVFAPNFLSMEVPASLGYRLVEGDLAEKASELLAKIPVGVSLHECHENPFDGDVPALALWNLVDSGSAPVRTSKLLARKRPHLLPILDSVVQSALMQRTTGRWKHYFQLFSDESLVKSLEDVRSSSSATNTTFPDIARLSLLRTLDIALWMEHRPALFGASAEKAHHVDACLLSYLRG